MPVGWPPRATRRPRSSWCAVDAEPRWGVEGLGYQSTASPYGRLPVRHRARENACIACHDGSNQER